MALDNYDDLKQEIIAYLDRSDLDDRVDGFIDLAEEAHRNDIRYRDMLRRSQANVAFNESPADRYLALPANFLKMSILRLLTTPKLTVPAEKTVYELSKIRREERHRPFNYAVHEEIEFDFLPDEEYAAEMIYFASFVPLSDENPVNQLLERAPATYLYGALAASAPFLMHDERLQTWVALYDAAVNGLNNSYVLGDKSGAIFATVDGATP